MKDKDLIDILNLNISSTSIKLDNFKGFIRLFIEAKGNKYFHNKSEKTIFFTLIHEAILQKEYEILDLLLNTSISVDMIERVDKPYSGYSFMHSAVETGDLSIVELLVKKGSKIALTKGDQNTYCFGDHSGILAAIRTSNHELVEYLIEIGLVVNANLADYDRSIKSGPILLRAIEESNIKSTSECVINKTHLLLVEHGACVRTSLQILAIRYSTLGHKYLGVLRTLNRYNTDFYKKALVEDDKRFQEYSKIMKNLLDLAPGFDIKPALPEKYAVVDYMDVSGFNFIGVSYEGRPITREFLRSRHCKNVDQALFTLQDLEQLESEKRKKIISERIKAQANRRGMLTTAEELINLSSLSVSAEFGDVEAVRLRLENKYDLNEIIDDSYEELKSRSPIVRATMRGYAEIVKLLANAENIDKTSVVDAYFEAKQRNNDEVCQILFPKLDGNVILEEGNTLLHKAILNDDIDMAISLIQQGANVSHKNSNGCSPLKLVISKFHVRTYERGKKFLPIIQALLDNGAKEDKDDCYSALIHACYVGSVEAIEMLVEHADKRPIKIIVDKPTRKSFWNFWNNGDNYITLPWYARCMFCCYSHPNGIKILKILRQYGANFDCVDQLNNLFLNECISPSGPFRKDVDVLHTNTMKYRYDLIRFLLENDADPNAAGKDGHTSLDVVARISCHDQNDILWKNKILQLLVQHGAELDSKNKDGVIRRSFFPDFVKSDKGVGSVSLNMMDVEH